MYGRDRRGPQLHDRDPPAAPRRGSRHAAATSCHDAPAELRAGRRAGTRARTRAARATPAAPWRGSRSRRTTNAATSHPACCPRSSARVIVYAPRDEQQHEQRVGVVEPEHQRGDRREREHRAGEQRRRPARTSASPPRTGAPTAATPSSACGTRMLHEFTPKMRAEISMTHSDAGVLSTVIEVAGVDRAEEERLPALRAGLHRRRVVACSPNPTRRGPTGRARR